MKYADEIAAEGCERGKDRSRQVFLRIAIACRSFSATRNLLDFRWLKTARERNTQVDQRRARQASRGALLTKFWRCSVNTITTFSNVFRGGCRSPASFPSVLVSLDRLDDCFAFSAAESRKRGESGLHFQMGDRFLSVDRQYACGKALVFPFGSEIDICIETTETQDDSRERGLESRAKRKSAEAATEASATEGSHDRGSRSKKKGKEVPITGAVVVVLIGKPVPFGLARAAEFLRRHLPRRWTSTRDVRAGAWRQPTSGATGKATRTRCWPSPATQGKRPHVSHAHAERLDVRWASTGSMATGCKN